MPARTFLIVSSLGSTAHSLVSAASIWSFGAEEIDGAAPGVLASAARRAVAVEDMICARVEIISCGTCRSSSNAARRRAWPTGTVWSASPCRMSVGGSFAGSASNSEMPA
jgi:hypothetical protein